MIPNQKDLIEAIGRVQERVHKTPVLKSRLLDDMTGSQVYLKCENFQKGGSYKIRGATNAIMRLSDEERARGVITHSSGNFGQALALAASNVGVAAYIVMPQNAPTVKKEAIKDYGAEVILCPSSLEGRETYTKTMIRQIGATFIHPSNDVSVILGQATVAVELMEQVPDLDCIICPVGGGGLAAGVSLVSRYLYQNCAVIGAEPLNADDAYRSLKAGRILPSINPDTVADGLRSQLGDKTFPILLECLDRIICVSESEIIASMRFIWERVKIIVEPSSAVTLAAIVKEPERFKNKKVGLIITGGNVSLDDLPFGKS